MKRIAAALALALALAFASAASAMDAQPLPGASTWHSLDRNARVRNDLAIAAAYWHAAPDCPNGYHVWRAPLGGGAGGQADMPGCRMWLDPIVLLQDQGIRRWQNAYLCVVVVHEYGHSLGHNHTTDPSDVMYDQDVWTKSVPACAAQEHAPRMHAVRLGGR